MEVWPDSKKRQVSDGLGLLRKKWLIAVDGSSHSTLATTFAYNFVDLENDFVEVVHVVDPHEVQPEDHQHGPEQIQKRYEALLKTLRGDAPITHHRFLILHDTQQPRKSIVERANRYNFDIVVTGFYGLKFEVNSIMHPNVETDFHGARRGMTRGRSADLCLRTAECSALICKRFRWMRDVTTEGRVWVLGTDGSESSEKTFHELRPLFHPTDTVHFVLMLNENQDQQLIYQIQTQWNEKIEWAAETNKFKGQFHAVPLTGDCVGEELCAFAKKMEATILAVGADGMNKHYNNGKSIIGSVTDKCVTDAPCPVYVGQILETAAVAHG